jgi:hypothetical protein
MMSKERELLVRIVNADMVEYMQLMGEAEELLAQPEQTEQEPVAWMQDSIELYVLEEKNSLRGYVIPLYTAPPKREPLTPQQISEGNQSMLNVTRDAFVKGVKFAEKMHGITGGEE